MCPTLLSEVISQLVFWKKRRVSLTLRLSCIQFCVSFVFKLFVFYRVLVLCRVLINSAFDARKNKMVRKRISDQKEEHMGKDENILARKRIHLRGRELVARKRINGEEVFFF